jgi:hypothetical protein
LFGWAKAEWRDLVVEDLIAPDIRDGHRELRAGFSGARHMAQGRRVSGLRADVSEFLAEVSLASLGDGHIPDLRGVLQHEGRRHGPGDLPVDRQGPWGRNMAR